MATYKPLGQVNPAAATSTTLYTCGVAAGAIGSTLAATNRGSTTATIRVAHRPLGAALANGQYVVYDVVLQATGTNANSAYYTLGISMQQTDIIAVYASTANVDFTLWGVESP